MSESGLKVSAKLTTLGSQADPLPKEETITSRDKFA
jgi:hypothetical protein